MSVRIRLLRSRLKRMVPSQAAAFWFVRCDSQALCAEEQQLFDAWRHADPLHAAAFEYAARRWRDVSVSRDDRLAAALRRAALAVPPTQARRRVLIALAACLLVVAIADIVFNHLNITSVRLSALGGASKEKASDARM